MGASWSAPVRNFFSKKTREEVQEEVEAVVHAAEHGLEKLDEVTSGAVTSLAEELSKAGVDLHQFKNHLMEGIEKNENTVSDDVHTIENEVTKTAGAVENISNGLKDEFHHVETQTEAKVENAKEAIIETAENAVKKTEGSVIETVSSVTSNLVSLVTPPSETKEDISAKQEETSSLLSQGSNYLNSGTQKAEETSTKEKKGEEDVSSFGVWKTANGNAVQNNENFDSKTEDSSAEWTTSLITKEKESASSLTGLKDNAKETDSNQSSGATELKEDLQNKKEVSADVKQGEEPAPAGLEKATRGLSFLQESFIAKKDEIVSGIQQVKETAEEGVEKVAEDVDNIKKEVSAKKKEITSGLSSDLHFLRNTVVASKDVVVEALHLGRPHKDDEEKELSKTSAPEFQSTQKPLGTWTEPEEEKPVDSTNEHSSQENSTNTVEVSLDDTTEKEEMDDKEEKKEDSPLKQVSNFLEQEISDASIHIEAKKEEVKQDVSEAAAASENKVQVMKHSLFDNFTDISATITNTLHNIETEIENTGKNVLTGVGTKVKEAGDFIAGTEEVDDKMDDKELKTEAVTSLLDKSFI